MSFTPPFVLLDDARATATAPARLYTDPVEIVTTRRAGEVAVALEALRTATRGGLHAAGYLAYEAGAALEPKLGAAATSDTPLLWFGLFRRFREIAPGDVAAALPDAAGGWLGKPVPDVSRGEYEAQLAQVKALIEAGDIYQANLTFAATVATAGHPLALYAGLRARSANPYGAVVATGKQWLLSLSPELFFALHDGKVTTRPMKGTAPPDAGPEALAEDPKQRAENLMIVDLLRNDLSRVAATGSVAVPELFRVERYPTVQQMTSTVTAQLAEGRDAVDVIGALFPCGSITGAPKIRAMQAIREIEARSRGVYTGAIGRIDTNGDAAFNVAIRTLVLNDGDSTARLGLGSGIVADSVATSEWIECLAKGAFVPSARRFDLIETMRFEPEGGLARLDLHLARMKASADLFGFAFDRHAARNDLQAATFRLREPARVRLLLGRGGHVAVEVRVLPPVPAGPVEVRVVPLPVDTGDFRLRHKSTDRAFYDAARGDAFEVVFADSDGCLTEGSFTNIFVERDGVLLTPSLDTGLLGGILRQELIAEGRAREAELCADDLRQRFFIGNSLRGLLPATLAGL
ncbi:aminodeoxychorismate synthase component I [Sphingomonas sp. SUN039]|uniref:aminodeoxychorismate synthase component I n=1 Tax=Sphingomonas sp. SUN039 TaxID=2937787 RepID=UPI002164C45E|nr:aminodeoxychorismate synthase component I [Sphingomonas sp. SUN039]UVO54695.1 aminodeoxychorismate synthase component I [Sphingomonas sp. SUN039]